MILSLLCCSLLAQVPADETLLADFSAEALPAFITVHAGTLERVPHEGGFAHEARFGVADWPNVKFTAPDGVWDWSARAGVAVSLFNPADKALDVHLRVDNAGADGLAHCNNASGTVPAHGRLVLRCTMNTGESDLFWGMRGLPGHGPGTGPKLDPARITAFQVFLSRPAEPHALLFERAWLYGKGGAPEAKAPLPFIDTFGQYIHEDWPGKLRAESELTERRDAEAGVLAEAPALPGRDRFGGWADGPKREATGWFRTEQVDGRWWLVTPDGTLFLSLGVDCVNLGEHTFIDGRDGWFAWLPGEQDTAYEPFLSFRENVHSHADRIGGRGRTFCFYGANLLRKYGDAWLKSWRDTSYRRLCAWGFNTLGNWCQGDVLANSPMPFTASTGVYGVREIAGAAGYWSKMKDVYAPEFEAQAEKAFAGLGDAYANNPLCIGFFSDNELSWEGFAKGTLESPVDQPARVALITQLTEKHGDIVALNAAWGTSAADWAGLRTPNPLPAAAAADLDAFMYRFARRYFEVIRAACRKAAPHQLYLGCRFAGAAPAPVTRACAEVCDVMSYNLYQTEIARDRFREYDRPIIIGEFHFGALDRGMFHTGLVPTENQAERAACYARYVRSVIEHPRFVGCHWFQYVDEPNTGRCLDGENYNIGFVDVTDTPYPELVSAARAVHAEAYTRRAGAPVE